MKQTIEIEVPDGKKAVWKDGKVVFENIKPQLPNTWEEFCKSNPIKRGEYFIDSSSQIVALAWAARDIYATQNVLPSYKAAEAHLAFMQLHQLRDCYRNGWLPNNDSSSHVIERYYDPSIGTIKLRVIKYYHLSKFLSFQTEVRAKEFLNNFKDLIKQAGDLI